MKYLNGYYSCTEKAISPKCNTKRAMDITILYSKVPWLDTLWVENCDEIALSRTVKEIEAILCFAIFGKNPKIQNGRHFWGGEIFLKIAKITFLRYPMGRKFRRNRSISYGF